MAPLPRRSTGRRHLRGGRGDTEVVPATKTAGPSGLRARQREQSSHAGDSCKGERIVKSRVILLLSLLLAVLIPLMVLGSSGCGKSTSTPENEVWTRQFGTSDSDDLAFAVVADGSGNVYVAGGTENPSIVLDAFITKYDASGNEIWTRRFGTTHDGAVHAMVADGSGNIYMAGGTGGMEPGARLGFGISGADDTFFAKYDASGNEIWTRQFGNLVNEYEYVMAADGAGNIYVANTVSEYPSSVSKFLSCGFAHDAEGSHVLLAKYDTSGKEVWAGKFATGHWDTACAIAAEGSGNIYVAGKTGGDVFIMKLGN